MREGWVSGRLGNFFEIVTGGTPPKSDPEMFGNYMPLVKPPELTDSEVSKATDNLSLAGAKSSRVVPIGSVLVSCIGNLGKLGLAAVPLATNQQINAIKPNESIALAKYVFYWAMSPGFSKELLGNASGTTVPIVNKSKFSNIEIALPPLPEQKRIVAILDEAFAGIATAVANTEKNLANAHELFESYLNSVFSQRGDGWIDTALSSLIRISHGFAFKGSDFRVSSDASRPIVLTPGNYTEMAELDFSYKNTKRFFGKAPVGFLFDDGDLTIVMTDLSSKMKILGKPAFINKPNVLHNQRIGRVILHGDKVDPRFLYYFMRTRYVAEEIKRTSTGTMVKHTAPGRILALRIPLPKSPQLQQEIVSSLDSLSTEVRRAESIFRQKLNALTELKQSLLQKAFSGELTTAPQDEIETALA